MRIIIIGCGRMGAGLALSLVRRDHTVTVIDRDPAAFENLGAAFGGQTIGGVGFDRGVLLSAGVERADGLAAVTSSDEANVVAARAARQHFHVPRVVARLYDPRKAEIYRRLGLQTVSTTSWGIHRITELLCYSRLDPVMSLGHDVDMVDLELPPALEGRLVRDLTMPGEVHVVAITRSGRTFLPALETLLQPGDRLHLAVAAAAVERLRGLLGE